MRTAVFPGSYESLAAIGNFIRQAAQDFGLSSCASYAVETAVDEACSNIIEHAYGGEGIGDIFCSVEMTERELRITLEDTGKPFNPEAIKNPDINSSLEDRDDHGLGLYFMRQWMDEVTFHFSQGRNQVTMIKRKGKKS